MKVTSNKSMAATSAPVLTDSICQLQRGESPAAGHWRIASGFVRALTWDEDGELISLALWGPGDRLPAASTEIQPYVLEALAATTLEAVPADRVAAESASPGLRGEVLLSIVGCRRVSSRLLKLLVWLGSRFGAPTRQGWEVDLPLSHQTLAELIGSTRATITRLLKQLEQEGHLRRGLGQSLVIVDTGLRPCA
jgi:CRP-like cAMP-binding protein